MEYLIKEAFLHVAELGPHVADGHYDLLGPKDEIIMPSIWESVIEPGWEITMHMWPIPEPPEAVVDELAGGMADVVIVEPGVPPPPPGGETVDGVLLPLLEQPLLYADCEQKRKARKKKRRFRHSWPGLQANRRRAEEPLKETRSEVLNTFSSFISLWGPTKCISTPCKGQDLCQIKSYVYILWGSL